MTTVMNKERIRKRRKRKIAQLTRKLTVAPIMALLAFTILLFLGGVFENIGEYFCALIFIVLTPISAYPLQKLLPTFRDKGREGQRTLAMIMANVGYILAILYSIAFNVSGKLLAVFLTYMFSGIAILVFNKLFRFRASGHACGAAGPIGVLVYYLGITTPEALAAAVIGVGIIAAVLWGSLKTHSHTASQFLGGALIPLVIFYTINLI